MDMGHELQNMEQGLLHMERLRADDGLSMPGSGAGRRCGAFASEGAALIVLWALEKRLGAAVSAACQVSSA